MRALATKVILNLGSVEMVSGSVYVCILCIDVNFMYFPVRSAPMEISHGLCNGYRAIPVEADTFDDLGT
jgi:hypothetical protein